MSTLNSTDNNLTQLTIDTLLGSDNGLTAAELAKSAGVTCAEIKLALGEIAQNHIDSRLIAREGRSSKVRVFNATTQARLVSEASLFHQAEFSTVETLGELTKATLQNAARVFGVEGLKVKATKAAIIEAILAQRETVGYHYCVGATCNEPVEKAGETCEICLCAQPAARKRAPRSTGETRKRIRKPDVELCPGIVESARKIIENETSARGAQRALAIWYLNQFSWVDAEILRTLLRTLGKLSAPNFTVNMKKDGFTAVRHGKTLKGWTR